MEEKAYKNRKQQRRERQIDRLVRQFVIEHRVHPVLVCRRKKGCFAEYTYFIRRKRK